MNLQMQLLLSSKNLHKLGSHLFQLVKIPLLFSKLNNLYELYNILIQCSDDDYNSRIDSVQDNLIRSRNYIHAEDWIYNNILKDI